MSDNDTPVLRLARTGNRYSVGAKRDGRMITATSSVSFEDAEAKLRASDERH